MKLLFSYRMSYRDKTITFRRYSFLSLLIILMMGALFLFPQDVHALKDKMRTYISPSGVFQVKIPDGFKIQRNTLRTTAETVINGERLSSVIDQRPYKDQVKHYIVQLEQTLGPAINDEEKEYLVEDTLKQYADFYRQNNHAIVKAQEKAYYRDNLGGEIYLTYKDSKNRDQSIRIKVLYTDVSKIQLIATSNDQATYSLRNQEFFNSIRAVNGTTNEEGDFLDEWEEHVSPLHIFSVLLPPKVEPYTPGAPVIEKTDNAELFYVPMYDPVRNGKFDYRIYGYRLDEPLSYASARQLLIKKHIVKYIKFNSNIDFTRTTVADKYPVIETNFFLPVYRDKSSTSLPQPNAEQAVLLRASFLGNYIVVQEVESTRSLLNSEFAANLLSKMIFHPEEAEKLRVQENAPSADKESQQKEEAAAE